VHAGGRRRGAYSLTTTITAEMSTQMMITICMAIQ
jgi:hypothetical protein